MSTAKASSVIVAHLWAVRENILAVSKSLDEVTSNVMAPVTNGTGITIKLSVDQVIKGIVDELAAGVHSRPSSRSALGDAASASEYHSVHQRSAH